MKIIKGDLIKQAKEGLYDVIGHATNCFCMQGAGVAALMAKHFRTDEFKLEEPKFRGRFNKLGNIDFKKVYTSPTLLETYLEDETFDVFGKTGLTVFNAYTQYEGGNNLDMVALLLCLKKVNFAFKGKKVGLPLMGGGIAGGDPVQIIGYMKQILKDVDATLVLLPDMYDKLKLK